MPQLLNHGQELQYPFYRRLGGPRAGLDGCEEEKIFCHYRF